MPARDNVYLEFGLYAGILTYARCFFLIQEGCQIASDLLGVNVVFFDKMQDLSKKILTITEKYRKNRKLLESVFYHLLAWQLDILKIF